MINRKVSLYLDEFYTKRTTPALLVTGARQTGKSYAIREFGRRKFKHFVEINFIETPSAIESLGAAKSTEELLLRIKQHYKDSTVIFVTHRLAVVEFTTDNLRMERNH